MIGSAHGVESPGKILKVSSAEIAKYLGLEFSQGGVDPSWTFTNCPVGLGDPSDPFEGVDGSAVNSDRWISAGVGADLIQGGKYEMSTGASEWTQINSRCKIVGDYDVQVDFSMTGSSPYNFNFYWQLQQTGSIYQYFDFYKDTTPSWWQLSTNNYNFGNDIVDHQNLGFTHPDPPIVTVRATRVGSTVTCWASYPGSGGFVNLNSRGSYPTGNVQVIFRGYNLAGGVALSYWDNFKVNSADDIIC